MLVRVWLLSLSITLLRLIPVAVRVAVRVSSPALVTAEWRRVLWMPPRWLTRSLVGGLCAVSRFELLRVKLLRTFVYRSVFLFFSGKCREVELQVIC